MRTWTRIWQIAVLVTNRSVMLPGLAVLALLLNVSPSAAWGPPIGIPTPSFGIAESHTMYAGQLFDYNGNGQLEAREVYQNAGNGPYTHYVDNTNSACTDIDNFGTPAKPLCRVPSKLSAGSVVEIRGRYNVSHDSPRDITALGTASRPVFIRGASVSLRPYLSDFFSVLRSTYLILENLEFGDQDGNLSGGTTGFVNIIGPTHHVALRNSDIHGNLTSGGVGVGGGAEDVVLYQNNVHDNGNFRSPDDDPRNGADRGGIAIGQQSKRIWVVDNICSRNGRACVNLNPGYYSDGVVGNAQIQYVYVGRNVGSENRETNFWTKHANHVIFSQNTASRSVEFRSADRRGNGGMGFQYGPDNVWFLFNHIYDENAGIVTQSDSVNNPGQNSYFIGNVIHNIHHGPESTYNSGSGWAGAGIRLSNGNNRYVIGNTIYDVDAGINTPTRSPLYMYNNIIANVTEPSANHVYIENPGAWDIKNCLFFQNGATARIRVGGTVYSVPELLNIGQGQGSLTADPQFVNAGAEDFHIKSGSPAINAGITHAVYQTFFARYGIDISKDAEHVSRPQGSAFDIGAYEAGAGSATLPASPTVLFVR